jgi:hypothetical protein
MDSMLDISASSTSMRNVARRLAEGARRHDGT